MTTPYIIIIPIIEVLKKGIDIYLLRFGKITN